MECSIKLERLRFYAHHGVMEQERRVGNDFEVTIEVWYPFEKALESDNLKDTLNYATLYAIVEREMAVPSELLERVAGRIIETVKNEIPEVTAGILSISKLHPPFKCDMPNGSATVTVKW
jgi:dihydroneopterin aldolase